ncbi:MAG: hisH [Clostridia bacterium]|nr:hisH [Clostridia bacterium]
MNLSVSIIDYGAGNLKSVSKALDYLKINNKITGEKSEIEKSDAIILPGVGAFPDAVRSFKERKLFELIKEQALLKPFLGICLGMQLLFEKSYEFEECKGLGLIEGYVDKIKFDGLKIPHMGWNNLKLLNPSPILKNTDEDTFVYFVHSFMAYTEDKNISAYTVYGDKVTAAVRYKNIFGTQFHPEKSGDKGIKILKDFINFSERYTTGEKVC